MDTIEFVINEILKFSSRVLTVMGGATEKEISDFEEKYNLALPGDYKFFLKKMNGLNLMGTIVYGIHNEATYMSLGKAFNIEHYEVENGLFPYLIPFSPDGGGNHYCFDSSKCNEGFCKVVFWQYDVTYSELNPPEIVYNNFTEWAKEVLVDWTLEDYDYNGNKR